ncbi:MAG: ABC transporter permease [Spirochaetaceae bacterium]|nr:ABC transporter permease [Spirochaetaceae bacterium]
MKFLILLALKNLTRHKRRTLITAGAIAVGILMFIFLDSMLKGADIESIRNLKWYETSSLRIMNTEYWDSRFQLPLDINIPHGQRVLEKLNQKKIQATGRVVFSGDMIFNKQDFGEEGSMAVTVTAIEVARDFEVFHYQDTLIAGRFLKPGEDAVLLGSWLAEDIGAAVGFFITIVARGLGGFYEAMDLKVVGIVNCPNPYVNRKLVMMPLDTADEYLILDGAVTEIDIKLPDSFTPEEVRTAMSEIEEIVNDRELSVMTWMDLASDYLAGMEMERGGTAIILFLIFIIAAVGISNTMLMSIFERIRELGMMRSMGMSDKNIRITFILEAAGIGLIGSLVGVLLGIISVYFLIRYGIDYGLFMRDYDMMYRIQAVFRGAWNFETMGLSIIAGTFISTFVAYFPTSRALRMDIPACLRHQ